MKFAVQLIGSKPVLENVSACFQGDFARIKKVGDDWFLESSAFDNCTTGLEVFPIAAVVLGLINRVTAVYARLFLPFQIGYVEGFSDTGSRLSRTIRANQRVQIYSGKGISELQESRGEQSLGSIVVSAALADKKLQEALALIGDAEDLQWSQLYNILEFLGRCRRNRPEEMGDSGTGPEVQADRQPS